MNTPLLIAHRGDAQAFPENTMEAFESAFAKGADGIELDVQEQDGRLLVVHNYTYDRTGVYPELHQVLERFADKGRLEIEVKSLDLGFMDPLKELLDLYPSANIELTTSVAGIVRYLRDAFPERTHGIILPKGEFEPWMKEEGFLNTKILKLAQLYESDVVHVHPEFMSPELGAELKEAGFKIHSHIHALEMDEQVALYESHIASGVSQMTIDDLNLIDALHASGTRE